MVRESQKKRGASLELVDEVIALFAAHKQGEYYPALFARSGIIHPDPPSANYEKEGLQRELNILQKEIGTIKKAKGDATELLAKKAELDKKIAELAARATDLIKQRDLKARQIGNIVADECAVSSTEVGYLRQGSAAFSVGR